MPQHSVSIKLEESIERLVSRDDVIHTKERVYDYINSGKWTEASFVDYLEQHADRNPKGVAISDEDGTKVSYKELNQRSNQFALSLLELGLRPDDRIALQLPNCHQFVISFMGAAKARVLPVLCHLPYTEHDLDYVIGLTKPKAILIPGEYKNKNYIDMIERVKEKHPCLEHIIVVSQQRYEGTVNFYDLLEKGDRLSVSVLEEVRPVGTDPFYLMFTSGTTGRPKASLHLHANNLYHVEKLVQYLNDKENINFLVTSPVSHLFGLGAGVLAALYCGGTVTLLSTWNVKKAVDVIEKEKLSYFLGIAPMLVDLARIEDFENRDLSSIKHIFYGGAPCPSEILNILYNKTGCKIMNIYGYSEGAMVSTTRLDDDISITSMSFGKVTDGVEMKIVDESGNELLGPCEGEVWARGANFIAGYYLQPEHNKKMFDKDGWFHSADLVRRDENGYCVFLSRRDDLINRGGYKIDPREIEEVLHTHPSISQIAVVAAPDERLGERIAAFIILKNKMETLELKDITDYLAGKGVGKKHWPEVIKIVDSFPKNSAGKLQKFALREQAKELKFT